MLKTAGVLFVFVIQVLLTGCASSGLTASSHVTNVQMTNANFKMVATNVSEEATARAILGVSYGLGIATTQLSIIPLDDGGTLYQSAMKNLWANFETIKGAVANRVIESVTVYTGKNSNCCRCYRIRMNSKLKAKWSTC